MANKKRNRTIARQFAIQMLYQYIMTNDDIEEINERFYYSIDEDYNDEIKSFAFKLFTSAVDKIDEYDDIISKFLKDNWTIDRINEMDKNVLRVAIAELFNGDAPFFAILDDYVNLAADFSGDKSAAFVNGILENIRKKFQVSK